MCILIVSHFLYCNTVGCQGVVEVVNQGILSMSYLICIIEFDIIENPRFRVHILVMLVIIAKFVPL
jgi:hypothetical protein